MTFNSYYLEMKEAKKWFVGKPITINEQWLLEKKVKEMEDKVSFVCKQYDELKYDYDSLKREKKELEKENRTIRENSLLWQSTMEEAYNRIIQLEQENEKLKEENEKLKKENSVMKDRLKFWYKWVTREEIDKTEKENRKLKAEIEIRKLTAKDYAKQYWVELDDNLDDIIEK